MRPRFIIAYSPINGSAEGLTTITSGKILPVQGRGIKRCCVRGNEKKPGAKYRWRLRKPPSGFIEGLLAAAAFVFLRLFRGRFFFLRLSTTFLATTHFISFRYLACVARRPADRTSTAISSAQHGEQHGVRSEQPARRIAEPQDARPRQPLPVAGPHLAALIVPNCRIRFKRFRRAAGGGERIGSGNRNSCIASRPAFHYNLPLSQTVSRLLIQIKEEC